MHHSIKILVAVVAAVACDAHAGPRERLVGGPCEGCEAVFEGRPARLASTARIAPATEPGASLVVEGTVTNARKQPVGNVIVYAYQTNAKGVYPRTPQHDKTARHRHGMLRGFARTGRDGSYRFETVRPGSYTDTRTPQHIHMHVVEPGRCHYYIDDVIFTDDPWLSKDARARMSRGRGGPGVTTPTRDKAGTWHVRRDIVLGAGIHDYARCGAE